MDVLPKTVYSTALALTALLAVGQADAAEQSASSAARAAARAAVVAYAKQRERAQQQLQADDVNRVQEIGRVLLAAQAGVANSPADEALRQEINALHATLARAIVAADTPRFDMGSDEELAPVEIGAMDEPPAAVLSMQLKNGNAVVTREERARPKVNRPSKAADTRAANSASAQRKPDGYATVRKRLDDMQSRLNAAKAEDFARADGNATGRGAALRSKNVAAKTQQLSDAVRAAIDARPSPENKRKLVELRDRLRQKQLDEVLSERDSAAAPVTPTLTTSIHHR